MTTCGERLVQLLESAGIDTVFGIPGVHTVELYRGLPATRLRHVTPRHEQGAGFMADGYARATGRVAACFIITGPGMTNIATAMGQAYAESVPMLVISSVNGRGELGRGEGRLHELPGQRALVAGVAAFSHTLMTPDELPGVLAQAFSVFHGARPRPVHIEIPLDVIVAAADHLPTRLTMHHSRPGPDPQAIARAGALLRAAERPLVVLGGGTQGAADEARALVDQLGAPVVLTINAKGVLPPSHPLLVGSVLPQLPVLQALAEADVVLAVGTELGETDTLLFDDRPQLDGRLIRVDIDAAQLHRNAHPEIGIVSDAGSAMAALAAQLDPPAAAGAARARALRDATDALLDPRQRAHARMLETLRATLPDAIVVGDQNQPVYSGNLVDATPSPRSWFNASTGYGTLGYGFPAALGAKLGAPGRPVVALMGDGGLQFTINELCTAVELGLPVPIVVWNNRGYGEIKRYMADRGIPQIGVDLYTPDFQLIARGYGAHAVSPHSRAAFAAALKEAHAADRPTLIELDESEALAWT